MVPKAALKPSRKTLVVSWQTDYEKIKSLAKTMYQLDKGIFLEDKSVLLPWGQPLDKLTSENNAEVLKKAML